MSSAELDTELMLSVVAAMPDDPLSALRQQAVDRFARIGFPTVGDEDWKYTNLSDAAMLSNEWLASAGSKDATPSRDLAPDAGSVADGIDAHWIVIRDGLVDGSLPDIEGVELSRLAEDALPASPGEEPMTLFNSALLRDGICITVRSGHVVDKPIGILYVDDPGNTINQSRVVLDIQPNAAVQLAEVMLSAGEGRQFTNSVASINIAAGARLEHVRIQSRSPGHTGVARITASLDRDAAFHHNSFDFGGALTRTDLVAGIDGPGADVSMNGLYLASGTQHVDNHTCIAHNVGPAKSREEYRGILAGRSQCVFNGKVIVAVGADGTDSGQSNHNLLLSDRAEIDTKPELEIYADDVKCAHGATVGQLDETALFYLRSRGIDPDSARQMITRAFAAETLGALSVEACREYLEALLDERLRELVGAADD